MSAVESISDEKLEDTILELSESGKTVGDQLVMFALLREYENRHGESELDSFIEDNEIRTIIMERTGVADAKAKAFVYSGMAKTQDGDGVKRSTYDGNSMSAGG